jgi:iron uptake system component EfeO
VERRVPALAVGLAAAGLVIGTAAGCTAGSDGPTTVEVSRGVCGQGWEHPHGGNQTFQVRNVGTNTTEVQLIDPGNGAVYAEIDGLAPGTTRPMQVRLARGKYAFKCLPEDTDALTGATVRVTDGPRQATPAVVPVDQQDLRAAVTSYRAYVRRSFTPLQRDVAALRTAIDSGDRDAARRAWLPAHLDYERLGAAYDTFGDAADAVDGLPGGLPKGVHDKGFTGFHRIEYGLWHGESMSSLKPLGATLVSDVAGLVRDFGGEETDPNDLPLRAHEILEATLQLELTGEADFGSGTTLATAQANVAGTRAVLAALHGVLKKRYPALPGVYRWLDRVDTLLAAQHHDGRWTPVGQLTAAQRRALDGAVGEALEKLAPIAALAEVRRAR